MYYSEDDGQTFNEIYIQALDSMAIGTVIMFAGLRNKIPNGWIECDGRSLSKTDYADLWDVIGSMYGSTTTTFNVPNFKGKVAVGEDANDTDFQSLGKTGGYKGLQKHTHQSVELGGNTLTAWSSSGSGGIFNLASLFQSNQNNNNQVNTGGVNGNATDTGAEASKTNGNLQPYLVVMYIIKAKNTTPTMASIVDTYSTSTENGYACNYVNNKVNGYELFYSATGTYGCTLSDSAANYSYLDIQYKKSNYYGFTRIYNPDGKAFGAQLVFFEGANYFQVCTQNFTISGTSITKGNGVWWNFYYDGTQQHASSTIDQVQIVRVVGYK